MKFNLTLFISLVVLASLAIAELPKPGALPSDEIQYTDPPKAISLQNVDRMSAWAIALSNPALTKPVRVPMADLGYYSSEGRTEVQDANATSLENFAQTIPEIPASVGNVSENITEINGTLAWW